MPQLWFEILASISLGVALISAAIILADILGGHRQMMAVMNWVWPITALYFGPIAVYAYWKLGRPMSQPAMNANVERMSGNSGQGVGKRGNEGQQQGQDPMKRLHKQMANGRPFWQTVWIGVTHCGAGCTLGDLIGERTIFILGVRLAGQDYWPEVLLDFALAYLLGVAFQYFSIAPMRGISGLKGLWAAMKADTLSLTAFEVGLFAWMALFMFVIFPHISVANPAYWFMMQIGMVVGFGTSYPMNWWLLRRGIKEPM